MSTGAGARWRLVAQREFLQRTRSKAFVVASLILAALAVAGVVLSAVVQDDERERIRVVIVERPAGEDAPSSAAVAAVLPDVARLLDLDVRSRTVGSLADAEVLVRAGDVDAGIDGTTTIWHRSVDDTELAVLQGAVQAAQRAMRAEELGLDAEQLRSLLEPAPVSVILIEPRAEDHDIRTATAGIGLVLLFLAVQVHGTAVLMGVVEEKSSRVVEVILGHLRPRALLAGKVLGIGAAGLVQVLIVAVAALGALAAVRSIDAPKVPAAAIVWFVVWFVLGFALYATVFASLGSLVSRQEDAQSVVTPATVPLMAAYFVGFAAVGDPSSTLVRVLSIVPLSSPMVMPVRLAAGDPPLWELALSLALVVAAIAAVLHLGARLYERNVLRAGAARGWRRAIASLRGDD